MVEKKGKVEERREGLSEEEFPERRQRIIQLEGKVRVQDPSNANYSDGGQHRLVNGLPYSGCYVHSSEFVRQIQDAHTQTCAHSLERSL